MKARFTPGTGWALAALVLCLPLVTSQASAQKLTLTTESEDAKQHFEMGMNDVDNVFFSRAAEHFAAAMEADPELAIAHSMHAWIAPGLSLDEREQRMDSALGDIAKASTPELLFASAVRRWIDDDEEGARALFAATAGLVPDDPHVAYWHALLVGESGSAERIAALEDVTERFPDLAAAFNVLAYAQWAAGDEAGARRSVARYAELLPDHPNSHDSVADILQFSGLFAQAVQSYERAISIDADYFDGYIGLAEARLLAGDANGARAALDEGREHAPSDGERAAVTRYEANSYFFEGDGAMGLSTLKEAAAALEATNNMGLAAFGETGRGAQAHRELAVAEALFGSAENIPTHIAKATELSAGNADNHSWAALAYGVAGNADAAREAVRAYDEATDGADFTQTLDGMVQLVSGRHAEAEKLLLESGLDDDWARAFMARCQHETGNAAEALALERELHADHQFNVGNFSYTLSRLTLAENGAGRVRSGLDGR